MLGKSKKITRRTLADATLIDLWTISIGIMAPLTLISLARSLKQC